MGKVAKMYQAFIWKLVRSPIVARYLSSEEDMEMLRLKLKESFENVSQDPKVAAQMAPFLNDDFRAMMEDTQKFREVGREGGRKGEREERRLKAMKYLCSYDRGAQAHTHTNTGTHVLPTF